MEPQNRAYKGKDADMLIVCGAILDAAITNKIFLQSKRATWADPFFDDLKVLLDHTIQNHLGIDNAQALRAATAIVVGVQTNALRDLAEFKVQFMEDFKNDIPRRTELLIQLGFTPYHKDAQKGDQEALINLLYRFKTNATVAVQTEISTAGTAPALLTTIIGYATTLKDSNISQEAFKGARATITDSALTAFNDIYSKVISIAKISAKFYKTNPGIQKQFSYSHRLKVLNSHHGGGGLDDAAGLPG